MTWDAAAPVVINVDKKLTTGAELWQPIKPVANPV
jgi:hypothetical protein